ncbi:soluble lytic murein transglycosylase [Lutimaribacter pacificus]|uniref:Soluble lytic murein transglycosylase n=1 Tax=Lutimaribacter pacificus TaxID=391948 RepID=A0A1H0N924_9RHOB|nr:lytic transglycosylase domain-containing protein [Lutimaribacter pacificus]SDO89192.1 soluble lytic murein transglycosylase [Lutimaribacter pacificus]SHK85514.1 soluble lytic murein transglycosylase [Lutimaribacter pacificus]
MQETLRRIALIMTLGLAGPAIAQEGPRPLASALDAVRGSDWTTARALAQRAGDPGPDIVEWHRLRAGDGTLAEAVDFLDRNADWPGLDLLRRRSEATVDKAPDDLVLRFFDGQIPQTGTGALAHARALSAAGRDGAAEIGLVLAWRTLALDDEEQAAFLDRHATILKPHHEARLDMALWRGLSRDAARMLPLVGDGWKALAAARMALRGDRDGVDALIAAVPADLADDPGLAYERFDWRIRKGRTDDAIALLLERSASVDGLGQPESWAGWRRYLARAEMRAGRAENAYALAASHWLTGGSNYADLEWLSGYIALHYLKEPALALDHFQRFRAGIETPISLGRAGYWIGRAQEALGDTEAARFAYAEGAEHQTSFYGLLAAERAGLPPDPALAGTETFAHWRDAPFTRSSVYRAGILALNAGQLSMAERFFAHLAETLDRTQLGQLGQMAQELDQPHLAVMIGKAAAGRGITLPGPYYALHPLKDMKLPVPVELALSIARRESEFDPNVVSGAGAQGLMQLMPGTAAEVAIGLGYDHQPARVLNDPSYNAILGSAYLGELAVRFDANIVMVAAAYNAGPSRPERWMAENGDPRDGGMDIVDWIEHIPFRETRNYVMRVAESLPVYRARLGRDPHPMPFSRELVGRTLLGQ